MSFEIAAASNGKYNGVPLVLRDALRERLYARGEYQIYDNMDSDPLIQATPAQDQPSSRLNMLEAIFDFRDDVAAMRVAAVEFCRTNQQQGPPFASAGTPLFGRVQRFDALVNAVANSTSGLPLAAAEALLRNVVTYTPAHRRLQRQRSSLAGKKLSRYQMWCYRAENPVNPFQEIGTTKTDAINVLGLGFYTGQEELVRWVHTLGPGVEAFQPTAWDAGAGPGSECWRPGGRTYRLDINDYGVPEFVHVPTSGEFLIAAIEAFP